MVAEKDKQLFEYLIYFELINIGASVIINIFLLYLIFFRTPKEIGPYKYMLFAFTLNDVYYVVIHSLTLPVICSYKDSFIMFSYGLLTSRVSICLYACTFSQTMPLLAHLFIYRLIVAKWPHNIKFYSGSTGFALVTGTVVVESSFWFVHCYINYGPHQEILEYMQPYLDEEFHGETIEFIGAVYYSTDGEFRWRAFFTTMVVNVIMMICMSIIAFCSYSIIRYFRSEIANVSNKTKKLQTQLFKTLVVQMIIPMVLVYFPCAGTIDIPITGFRMRLFPNLITASATFFPIVDAFVIMFGVACYREAVLKFLPCLRNKVEPASTVNSSMTLSTA